MQIAMLDSPALMIITQALFDQVRYRNLEYGLSFVRLRALQPMENDELRRIEIIFNCLLTRRNPLTPSIIHVSEQAEMAVSMGMQVGVYEDLTVDGELIESLLGDGALVSPVNMDRTGEGLLSLLYAYHGLGEQQFAEAEHFFLLANKTTLDGKELSDELLTTLSLLVSVLARYHLAGYFPVIISYQRFIELAETFVNDSRLIMRLQTYVKQCHVLGLVNILWHEGRSAEIVLQDKFFIWLRNILLTPNSIYIVEKNSKVDEG